MWQTYLHPTCLLQGLKTAAERISKEHQDLVHAKKQALAAVQEVSGVNALCTAVPLHHRYFTLLLTITQHYLLSDI